MLKSVDFMTKLHVLSQIPSSCTFSQLLVHATAPRILKSFFLSHVQILFYTGMIVPTKEPHLVPRLHIGDCFGVGLSESESREVLAGVPECWYLFVLEIFCEPL